MFTKALAGAAALAVASGASAVPARDSFKGTVSAARGAYRHDTGKVSIAIRTSSPGPAARSATFKLSARSCHGRRHCIRLRGTIRGTITVVSGETPDAGAGFAVSGSGTIRPLGRVHVSGSAHGTGLIASGHETLRLTLRARSGEVVVSAQSGLVPGFTSP